MKSSLSISLAALGCLCACSGSNTTKMAAANGAKFFSVTTNETPFYRYGPQQGNGPDQKLSHDTLMTVVRASFGFTKVKLMTGEQGYVASDDIKIASPAMVAAATATPPPNALSKVAKFRLDNDDPRLIAPPEPLPQDFPEPTPIPGAESNAAPIVP